jgi:hypothetical protein
MTRARRTARPPAEPHRPLYARVLRLRYVAPSGLLCFVFFEGAVALGILLGLAELVSWWGVLVLPAMVALMVKLNDVIAGSLTRAAASARPVAARPATAKAPALRPATLSAPAATMNLAEDPTTRLPSVIDSGLGTPVKRPWADRVEIRQQWLRQSATRRYE